MQAGQWGSLYGVGLAVLCAVGNAAGQILLAKFARLNSNNLSSTDSSFAAIVYLISGVLVYGICLLVWVRVLHYVNLSRAYAILASTFVLVPLAANLFLGESLSRSTIIGAGLIMAGIATIHLDY